MPSLNSRMGQPETCSHRANSAKLFEDAEAVTGLEGCVHKSHDNRTFSVRQLHFPVRCENRTLFPMDSDTIIEGLKRYNIPHDVIAEVIGRDRTVATKMLGGKRSVKVNEIELLQQLIAKYELEAGESEFVRSDSLDAIYHDGLILDYVPVEILPTYAGAGPGGTGDGDRRRALLPRALLDEIHAKPEDLLVIEIRGNSMQPDFMQGDQIVIDKRDKNTRHGGPFAIFDGDTFILKNVEHLPAEGKLRIFSTKSGYTDWFVNPEDVQIEGRPVWFGRRL